MKRTLLFRMLALVLALSVLMVGCSTQTVSTSSSETAQAETTAAADSPATTDSVPAVESDPASESQNTAETTSLSTEPVVDTDPAETSPDETKEAVYSSAFTERFPQCPEQVVAAIRNAPFGSDPLTATETWNEGEYDQLYILPRFIGTLVKAYSLTFSEDGEVRYSPDPVYQTVAEDGTVIYASLSRPEGAPAWYLELDLPDGRQQGVFLEYNGRTGSPPYEFISANPERPFAFVTDLLGADSLPVTEVDLNAFALAAEAADLDPWDAAKQYFTQLTEIGDGAAFTLSYGHEMDQDGYSFRIARFHNNYLADGWDLDQLVKAQYDLYQEIGNERGILGPEFSGTLPELQYQLTGLTVFNRCLAAKEIEVSVDGESIGVYTLSQDSFCTLIPLELPAVTADHPVEVSIRIISTYFGAPEQAWIDAYGGLAGNISGAL